MLDPNEYFTLARQTSPDALELLVSQLEQRLGRDEADELLAKVDRLLAAKPEVDAVVAEGLKKQQKALAKLKDTAGLQWGAWSRGYYVVTFDGMQIGSVSPGGRSGGRATSWRASSTPGGPLPDPYGTVKLAAEALADLARARST